LKKKKMKSLDACRFEPKAQSIIKYFYNKLPYKAVLLYAWKSLPVNIMNNND